MAGRLQVITARLQVITGKAAGNQKREVLFGVSHQFAHLWTGIRCRELGERCARRLFKNKNDWMDRLCLPNIYHMKQLKSRSSETATAVNTSFLFNTTTTKGYTGWGEGGGGGGAIS